MEFESCVEIYAFASASITPSRIPPINAPGIEPIPPNTAAVNALIPGIEPVVGISVGYEEHSSTPAIAASAEPIAKVREMVRLTLMPISRADLRACAHSLTELALACKDGKSYHNNDARRNGKQRYVGNAELTAEEIERSRDDGSIYLRVSTPDEECRILQQVGYTYRSDKHCKRGRLTQRLICKALDKNSEQRTYGHCDDHSDPRIETEATDSHE